MDLQQMLDDLNSYDGILIDGINEIVDNNVPIYSSNLWAEAPYLEEYINEVLASNKEYETILDVISIACAQYIEDFLYSNTTRLAKERGWQEDTMIDFTKGWNQFESNNLNKC